MCFHRLFLLVLRFNCVTFKSQNSNLYHWCFCLSGEFREVRLSGSKLEHMSQKHVVDFPFTRLIQIFESLAAECYLFQSICLCRRKLTHHVPSVIEGFLRRRPLAPPYTVTVVAIPPSLERHKHEDAVNNSFSGQSGKMKATGVLTLKTRKQRLWDRPAEPRALLKGQCREQPCVTICHWIANCTHSGAGQQPYQRPFMHTHHTLPFLSALRFFAVHEQLLCNHILGCSLISLQC